ncbi:hypothetical protein KJ657_01125 [Patescibacteria group bacterium]|nr:hypothetical protein [Patescibacteria group bacterium]MBU1015669.1 hypothetical protein [Patescibacteria group bacterium]MBU1685627.1 hypothetical protein [Patescibacteria group bacterium]MBU1938996.1 hypothetical protein [Patescibacteria group bacterium]
MSDNNKALEAIEAAEAALKLAKQYLGQEGTYPTGRTSRSYCDKAATLSGGAGEGRVIEGVFDGQNMVDKKGAVHPVPANYASKSKLIPGDVLKLTVTDEGKFLYKQIGPVERRTVIGPLVHNNGQYQILAEGKAYNVLLASVTYFRASVGDEVTLIIPMHEESSWGAIEAVLPKFDEADEAPKKTRKSKGMLDLEDELDI